MKNSRVRGEKRKIVGISLFVAFLAMCGYGWQQFTASPNLQIPNPTLPNPNAFDFYLRATQAQAKNTADLDKILGISSQTRLSFDQKLPLYRAHESQLNAWLKQNESALKLLRQGFAHEYREPPVRGMGGLSQHYKGFRELARVLTAESTAHAARGDWPGAARSGLDIMHFGYDIPRGTPLIGALVGYAVQAIGRRQLQELLPHLDAATCRTAARELEKQRASRVSFDLVLQEEKWLVASNLQTTLQSNKTQSIGVQFFGVDSKTQKGKLRIVSRRHIMNDFLNYMDALSASARQSYNKAPNPTPPEDVFTSMMVPAFARARWNDARADTANSLLLLGLALRAYKLEKGAYPETLTQLVPQYIAQVPADGFGGGEALRYKNQGATYLLWSIGSDKIDDGGKPVDNPKKTEKTGRFLMRDDSKGDFVFGVNR